MCLAGKKRRGFACLAFAPDSSRTGGPTSAVLAVTPVSSSALILAGSSTWAFHSVILRMFLEKSRRSGTRALIISGAEVVV